MAHEIGHAIHNQKGIISQSKVSTEFKDHFDNLKSLIKGKESTIEVDIRKKLGTATNNESEQLWVMYDILGSLTKGKYGGGHAYAYYQNAGKPEAEIFAHSVSMSKIANEFEDLNIDMANVVAEMKKKISDWL